MVFFAKKNHRIISGNKKLMTKNKVLGIELNKPFHKKNKNTNQPFCTMIKNDLVLEIHDYQLCRKTFLNIFH